jgi:hypothetical protein
VIRRIANGRRADYRVELRAQKVRIAEDQIDELSVHTGSGHVADADAR